MQHREATRTLCRYCGIHSASCVVKCVKTGKWFCNGRVTGTASCILTHLVRPLSFKVVCHMCQDGVTDLAPASTMSVATGSLVSSSSIPFDIITLPYCGSTSLPWRASVLCR